MNCPVCKTKTLCAVEIDDGLQAKECPECKGRWIPSFQYWRWRDQHGQDLPEEPAENHSELSVNDSTSAKLCPECGHLVMRYPVGHGIEFNVDRCGHCGGFWLDGNEWEILKRRNLHDDVHKFFSSVWQKEVRTEESRLVHEAMLREKFGNADYEKMMDIKNWIGDHPLSHEIIAYLNDRD